MLDDGLQRCSLVCQDDLVTWRVAAMTRAPWAAAIALKLVADAGFEPPLRVDILFEPSLWVGVFSLPALLIVFGGVSA